MTHVERYFFAGLGVLSLVACSRKQIDRDGNEERSFDKSDQSGAGDRVGTTTVTGADLRKVDSALAVERIVAARCSRETACNNIGPDKHFTDHDICAHELSSHIAVDLDRSACPGGVEEGALDTCLESIRNESCNNPVETIQRLAACRSSDLCKK